MIRFPAVTAALSLCLASSPGVAQTSDPNLGRNIAANCANCHGTDGRSVGGMPSLAGRPFNAGSGVKGVNITLGLTQALGKNWLMSFGFRYEKLMNAAKDSPITSERGKSNQWTNAVILSYVF